jgi:hypothetical protein
MHVKRATEEQIMTSRLSTLAGLALLAFGLSSLPALASSALIVKPVHALGGPGTTFAAVLDLGANSKVGILWCGPVTFDWCLVQFHKKQGWVHAGDLLALSDSGLPLDGPNKNDPAGPQGGPNHGPHEVVTRIDPPSHITLTQTTIQQVKPF